MRPSDTEGLGTKAPQTTRVVLSEALVIMIGRPLEEVQGGLYEALEGCGWLLVIDDKGHRVAINPQRVLYLEEIACLAMMGPSPDEDCDHCFGTRTEHWEDCAPEGPA